MNSYERIMATIKGEPVDRRAVGAVLSLYGAKLKGFNLEAYYNHPELFLEGQMAIVDKFGPDFLLSPMCVAHEGKAFGCEIRYFTNYPPNIVKRAIPNAEAIGQLKIPDWNKDPSLLYIRESIALLSKTYHGEIPIAGVWMDPLDMLACAIGLETFMELMIFNKKAFDAIMEEMIEFCVGYGNVMLSDGVDFLVNFGGLLNKATITRSMAESIAYPILVRTYSQLKGGVLLHSGGYKMAAYLDIYKDLPNLLGFVADSRDSLVNSRALLGPEKILLGNIEGPSIETFTPEQISKICDHMLREMAHDPHYILASSGADIPYHTSEAQIKALMDAPRLFAEKGQVSL